MSEKMFKRAERKAAKLRLALAGPAGSGKTYSALVIAKGMSQELGCPVCVIDTEKGSSNLYSHLLGFDVLEFNPPYEPDRYVKAIKLAEKEGYGICIIDSITHEWSGPGGCLEMIDTITKASQSKNAYAGWNTVTPKHNNFVESMLQSTMHIIATCRSKAAYELVKSSTGKMVPTKVGMAPITREGMDFEFTTWFDLQNDGNLAVVGKDRTELFTKDPLLLSEETGKVLLKWLNGVQGVEDVAQNA